MSEFLFSVPVVVRVLAALALIVAVNGLTKRLGLAMAAGAAALGLWCGHPLAGGAGGGVLGIAWRRLASTDLLLLLFVVVQVIWLSLQMREAGVMDDLVAAVRARISRRASMAVLPAVIGWLPMPGGALFSAPLVESLDADGTVQPVLKTQVNYWFRHVWEYWWPIYPGVLLAIDLSGLEIWQFVLLQLPLSLFAVAGGAVFLLSRIKPDAAATAAPAEKPARPRESLLRLVSPILVVVAVVVLVEGTGAALRVWAPGVDKPHKYAPMILGIFAAMLFLERRRPLARGRWRGILLSSRAPRMVFLVAMVRIFGALIEADLAHAAPCAAAGTPLVDAMHRELAAWGVPPLLAVALLPFLSGVSTGLAIGFVGASFPIVLNLVPAGAPLTVVLGTTALAYACGHCGMMLSPVHVCFLVTNEHFRTRVAGSLAGLVPPALVVLLGGVLTYALVCSW